MDKLPHNSNSLTSTSTTTNTTHTHWDLGMASMDTETRHHHILHSHQNDVVFPFSSIPTWQNYSPLPPPPPPPPSSSSSFFVQVETLVEEDGKEEEEEDEEELGAMKEMMYKIAAMQPVEIDPATIRRPKRRNVRISDDPQSVAARLRRERISEKIRILQCLVPGGTKLDTAAMLEEAVRYVKFLKRQIRHLQHPQPPPPAATVAARELFEGELPLCFSFNEG